MVSARPSLAVKLGKLELAYPTLMGSGCYGSGEEFAPFADLTKFEANPAVQNLGKQLTVADMCNFVKYKLSA